MNVLNNFKIIIKNKFIDIVEIDIHSEKKTDQ